MSDQQEVPMWHAETATEALGELWNSTLFVWNALFADGHYQEHSGTNFCELCEMWCEVDRALVATVDAVAAAGFEPVGYGFRRVHWLGSTAQAARVLWDNAAEDTKCQAMAVISGDDTAIAELVQVLSERWPEEATAFGANLVRHRAETTLWGCRA